MTRHQRKEAPQKRNNNPCILCTFYSLFKAAKEGGIVYISNVDV